FLISGARAASRRETVWRCLGLNRSQWLGAGGRRGTENDRRRKRKSDRGAGASRGQGGLLILVLSYLLVVSSRVGLSEGSLRLTVNEGVTSRLRADRGPQEVGNVPMSSFCREFLTCSHSTGSNLARQIVAAVHQFERHSIALITTAAKGFC